MNEEIQIQSVSGPAWPVMVRAGGVVGMSGSVSASEMICVGRDAVAGNVVKVGVASANGSTEKLVSDVWSFQGTSHWLTTRNPLTGEFQSFRVGSLDAVTKRTSELAQSGLDVYLSVSEFSARAQSRRAQDVACVRGFWLDIDVGSAKAEQGHGYATVQEAMAAVKAFRIAAGLPRPTHVIGSGRGLHVYWVVNEPIEPTRWLIYAKMSKTLTKCLGLLADPARTADIASLMRVPGTFNFKDKANPRAVKLIYASDKLIDKAVMLNAIEAAHIAHCGVAKSQTPALLKMQVSHGHNGQIKRWINVPVELRKLTSALCAISPDCAEAIWSLQIISPLARAARENPKVALDLYTLARHWSSGALCGLASKAWATPGGNGLTGEQYFDILWKRFLTEAYVGGYTLGTVYFHAKQAGWKP